VLGRHYQALSYDTMIMAREPLARYPEKFQSRPSFLTSRSVR
jgi:hypothetical protein